MVSQSLLEVDETKCGLVLHLEEGVGEGLADELEHHASEVDLDVGVELGRHVPHHHQGVVDDAGVVGLHHGQHQSHHVLELSFERGVTVLDQQCQCSQPSVLVAHFARLEALPDEGHEEGQHELVAQLVGDLPEVLLSTHGDVVLGDDLVDELPGPLLSLLLSHLCQHFHVGVDHVGFEILGLSHQGVVLVAEHEDARHCGGAQVDQQLLRLHHLSVDHKKVVEDGLDELGVGLHQFVEALQGSHPRLLVVLHQLDGLVKKRPQHVVEVFHALLLHY